MYVNWNLVKSRPLIDKIPREVTDDLVGCFGSLYTNTENAFKPMWEANLLENRKTDFTKFSIRQLRNKFKGMTAYLIGAGSSLKFNYQYIPEKKGIKIACAHSLKFLLNKGIRPDYTVIVDAQDKCKEFVDIGNDAKGITLIFDILASPKVLEVWKGEVLYYISDIQKRTVSDVWMDSGGSVMGIAYTTSYLIGCDKIVFVGMDLSMTGEKTTYCDDSIDEGSGSDVMETCNIEGKGIMTLARMYFYKTWLDTKSLIFPMEHINTSGGILGAYLEGNLRTIKQERLEEM